MFKIGMLRPSHLELGRTDLVPLRPETCISAGRIQSDSALMTGKVNVELYSARDQCGNAGPMRPVSEGNNTCLREPLQSARKTGLLATGKRG
jgi:hypothetical protein